MKFLILDDEKINYYDLPETTEPYFVVNYESHDKSINEIITLYSENSKWTMKSDFNIKLSKYAQQIDKITLEPYVMYMIHFELANKDIRFITMPCFDDYIDVSLKDVTSVVAGCGEECNIRVKDHGLLVKNMEITKQQDGFYVKNLCDNTIYRNGLAIKEGKVHFGDVFFVEGLRIIWLNQYFKINTIAGDLELVGLEQIQINKPDITNYKPTTEAEQKLKLYGYKDLFFHTPIIKESLEKRTIKLDSPPDKTKTEHMPIILTLGSTAVIGLSTVVGTLPTIRLIQAGEATSNDWINLGMSAIMVVVCVLFPIFTDRWQKGRERKKERNRVKKYTKYLNGKIEEINNIVKEQTEILNNKHLTLDGLIKQIEIKGHFMWGREITEEDFMQVRLGIGNRKAELEIEADVERFSVDDDKMKKRLYEVSSKDYILENVPITLDITKNIVTPFIVSIEKKDEFIKSIMLQLMFYYSAKDLKIIIFTNELRKPIWEDVIYSNHCWSDDNKTRFFATTEGEMSQISYYLEPILQERVKSANSDDNFNQENNLPYRKFEQYYLIVTDDFHMSKDVEIINKMFNNDKNYGISLLVFADNLKDLPSRLKEFTVIENGNSGIYERSFGKLIKTPFKEEYLNSYDIRKYVEVIGNIPIGSKDTTESIPTSISFLELYGAGKVEHLNILSRWSTNNPVMSLNAPLGLQAMGRMVGLDLHEKAHGPHGLIAGSTGSGKSEFIISYILSMAVNYHPYEVQFVLIDYKGGGLAGAFEKREKNMKIPHLVGTITNLDKGEMHRTLVSIKSELERRQRKFNEARDSLNESTIDIYKYQRLYREGKLTEPIAHLFIISDEFAELKAQQPDFMDELISTARIGRSLGVHLILATQKPSGVVNDQIWANSRFKICLKVQTPEDSFEILKKNDASLIKETGRFYLQVGNDELYTSGQSAWAGDKYTPTDHVASKINDSIDFIGNDGTIIKSLNDNVKNVDNEDHGDQLTNVVQYLYDLSVRENIKFNSLWLPNVPAEIFLVDIIKKYEFKPTKYKLEAIIGEYDRPTKQTQGLLTFDLTTSNCIIFGITGSGKENMLTTIVYGLAVNHTIYEVNFYIIDFGAETLNVFNKMPHVGEVLTSSDGAKVISHLEYLAKEIQRRKDLISEFGGSYDTYIKKSGKTLPVIITIINSYENFMENCAEVEYNVQQLLREGSKYGLTFIITANSTNSMRSSLLEYLPYKALLQLADAYDYKYMLGAPSGMVPSALFGRGIASVEGEACEFQTVYINKLDAINDVIRSTSAKLTDYYKAKAPAIKVMPREVRFEKMLKYTKYLNSIPIGYDVMTIDIAYYNFVKPNNNLIVGKTVTDNVEFMASIIDLVDSLRGLQLNIFDFASSIDIDGNATYYNVGYKEPFENILNNKSEEPVVNMMIGIGNVASELLDDEFDLFVEIMNNLDKLSNQYFIFFDNSNRIDKVKDEEWFKHINREIGIWVGDNIEGQSIFEIKELDSYMADNDMEDKVYVINNKNVSLIKCVQEVED